MNKYYIYVWWTKYEEYPLMAGYEIEATNRDEAEKLAREKYYTIYGGRYGIESKHIDSRVGWNAAIHREDLQYYREHGLPDEIPS